MSTTALLVSFGTPAPVDADEIQSTVTTVQADEPPAESPDSPDWNETETDPDTEGGLTSRQLASHVVPPLQYVPHIGDANDDPNSIVNRQVSTSGTAAAREMTGRWGHGTLKVVQGIEPTIREGDRLGADYFIGHELPDNAGGNAMSPAQAADPAAQAAAQRGAADNSRAAVQASQYNAWYNAQMGRAL